MSGECEINMTYWEAAINELYQLYNACKKRESQALSEIIQRLKKRNIKFKLIVGNGTTTLHLMCFHGNLRMVKLLVEMYGNIKAKDENHRIPFFQACLQGHFEIGQYLMYAERKCTSQCRDKDGLTPYDHDLAVFHNHTDVMNYFIAARGLFLKTELIQVIGQLYQLYTAYKKRDFKSVTVSNSLLCETNVKFVLKDTNCTTTLHLMCKFIGNLDVVKSLVEMYGNAEARDEEGRTPLHVACGSGCIDIVEYLISQCGCDREARDEKQYTPLFIACLEGQTNTVKYLVSRFRCKVDIRNGLTLTPLHVACQYGFTELVQYLINDCGCSPEVKEENMQGTPLHIACFRGHLEIVKYLASECKCSIETRDRLNDTPLYLACVSDLELVHRAEVILYLILEQGCDPEAETVDGQSPISCFYKNNELSMIKYCVKLKKHDPKTWKYRLQHSQCLNLCNTITEQPDSSYVQSNICIALSSLHIVCSRGKSRMNVVRFLVEKYGLDPMERPELIGSDNIEEASDIINSVLANAQLPSTDDSVSQGGVINIMTPLYLACTSGHLDVLQYLISKCGPAVSHHYDGLTIIACQKGHSDIMEYLLKYNTVHIQFKDGNTLLHMATAGENLKGAYEIVRILIASMSNLDQRNCHGETALHTVCKEQCPCRTDIIELLLSSGSNSQISNFAGKTPLWVTQSPRVFEVFMRYSPIEVCERILSDDIDEEQSLKLLQCLIQQHNWNPNNRTKDGDTALHLACKADRLITIKYIFSLDAFEYDPYAKNKSNQTPIELTSSEEIIRELIKHGSNPIDVITNLIMDEEQILQLLQDINEDKLNDITINGNNAVHLACLTDRVIVVKYLLKKSRIDVNVKNESDISPIQLTKNSEIIRELIRYGANPTDLYRYCRKILGESELLQTTVKVFVLGDSNVGKSTLISSLKKEGWFNFFTSRLSTAVTKADNTGSGHGIVIQDFNSKHCGQMTLYDFVGTRLFHESQSDLLCEAARSPRVFLVVTNLSGSDKEIISRLQYWLSFLEEMSSDSEFKNHTIIVGSNLDKCRNDKMRKAKFNNIKCFLQDRVNDLFNVDYHDFIPLDCRSHSSSDITRLRRCLAKLCIIARNPKSLAFNAHCFQVYIVDTFKERVAVSVQEILNKIRGDKKDVDENDPLNFLPQSDFQLQNLCIELHNKSNILYLRDSIISEVGFERSWIIIDKATLISQLLEAFDSKIFNQLPSNNGILSFNTISKLRPFKVYNSDMFVKFICHLEYCKEISDQETFQAITNSVSCRLISERCFFFPALIENSAPEGVWADSDNFSHHCGWILQCTKSEQFFTSKFLQTLILRVMFCNTYLGPSGASNPDLSFTLWKGGVCWGNIFGAESLVETFPNNKAALFLMRCRDANLAKCMEHRSIIIRQIRQCAKEFCGNLEIRESLICPSLVKKYPICTTPSKSLFDIKPLAFAVANVTSIEQPYASSLNGTNTVPIRDLLNFEPYMELSASIIQKICNINNPRYISCLTDDFLLHFTQQIRKSPDFIKIIAQILNDGGILNSNVDNLLSKLIEWRDTKYITYQQLHKNIDRFSIYAGLNIVDMVPGLAMEEFSTPPSSPMLMTRTVRKTKAPTADSMNSKTAKDSPNNLVHGMQLDDKPKLQDLDLLKLSDGSELRLIESVAAKWKKLAIRFGFEGTRICNIREGAFFKPEDACFNMFIRWLNGEHDLKPPTWYNLIQCLEEIDEFQSLARDVKEAIMLKGDDTPKLHQLYLLKPGDGSEVKIIDTVADEWTKLASVLGFDVATCESLVTGKESDIACKDMFTFWLSGGQDLRPATWDWLIKSLEDSGFTELANEIKKVVLDVD